MIDVIARTARRRPWSEGKLVWSLTGGAALLVLYYLSSTGLDLPNPLGLGVLPLSVVWAVLIGAVFGLTWYFAVKGKIQAAREAHAAHLHQAQADQYAETQQRIAQMKAKEAAR